MAKAEASTAKYQGLVMHQNQRLADMFNASPMAYHDALVPLVEQLRTSLLLLNPDDLKENDASSDDDNE